MFSELLNSIIGKTLVVKSQKWFGEKKQKTFR